MLGRVRCYLPAAKRGVLQSDAGDEIVFALPVDMPDLQGGDVVEFELAPLPSPVAVNVRLRQRWADMLNQQHRPLVNQFHVLIQAKA